MNNQTMAKEDKIVTKIDAESKNQELELLKNKRTINDNLNELLINKQAINKILEIDDKLIQKMDPIFHLDPPIDGLIRAHFFAPRKAIAGNYYDTYWINSFVIWFMSLVMAITLYFDVLKKLLDSIEKVFAKFSKNKR